MSRHATRGLGCTADVVLGELEEAYDAAARSPHFVEAGAVAGSLKRLLARGLCSQQPASHKFYATEYLR